MMDVINNKIYLKEFIELYNQSCKISKLKNLQTPDYILFSLKEEKEIVLSDSKKFLDILPRVEYLYPFFRSNRLFWIIPLELISGKIAGFILKSYNKKIYRIWSYSEIVPLFGFYKFKDFQKNNIIIITEGVKDALVLNKIYPYVLSLDSVGISNVNVELLRNLTNRIILCYDNDSTGRKILKKDQEMLFREKFFVNTIDIPFVKDAGDLYFYPAYYKLFVSKLKSLL